MQEIKNKTKNNIHFKRNKFFINKLIKLNKNKQTKKLVKFKMTRRSFYKITCS